MANKEVRYRIVIELDTQSDRAFISKLATEMYDLAVTSKSNPMFLSTEIVQDRHREILAEKDE